MSEGGISTPEIKHQEVVKKGHSQPQPEGLEPELKPLRLPAEVSRTWIAPDGTEVAIKRFNTHSTTAKKLGAVGDEFERIGGCLGGDM
ncbi:MAG: hypothetical protein COU27_03410 [Candidatus Levybacteria bacterium CG10_big_fil_rev_8_21_14_0_10_36_7]|nr:MAG: hypothetical protein COU27_03410 [Candidatus Levybacteria bacterium CG10_big_fil_rev_8_21_14_0_10_36_7]